MTKNKIRTHFKVSRTQGTEMSESLNSRLKVRLQTSVLEKYLFPLFI